MITYFRECAMPDSPDTKLTYHSTLSPKTTSMTGMTPTSRPLSANSSISGVNGNHSPHSTLNGRTPSPPTMGSLLNTSAGQQLPPACGARQLGKLKRFLTTLQQFGSDISPDIGERVRTLVLGLVNSHLSIEEFHSKLQEATNFPLRPFVIPFLKANLPLLQRELLHCARMAKQSPQQFLTQNEHIVFDPTHSPLETQESVLSVISESRKRRSPDSRPKENGLDLHMESPLPAKRHHGTHPISPVSSSRVSPGSTFNLSAGGPIRLEDISKSREMRERERLEREQAERDRVERERDRERHFSTYNFRTPEPFDHLDRLDDDWRHVETMLNCIIGMVDKTKRALSVLQERSLRDREELSLWARRQADGIDADVKKRTGDVMAYTIRQTEDRVSEVRRRAEEAVNDVKRQAMLELQKAVSAADQKAADLIAAERVKMERAITEARKQAHADLLRSLGLQEESAESCWNCGRKASETCSGCNVARYCGSFCQHKDWENHHHVCGKAHITSVAEAREMRRAALAATAAAASTSSATVAVTSSLSGGKDTSSAPCKGSPLADSASVTCISPTPSVVPSLSTKENVAAITSAAPSLTSSPLSSSPKSSSPVISNPATPVQDSESSTVASSSSATDASTA